MAAVNKHHKLNVLWPTKFDEGVNSGTDAAAGVEDIIYEDDTLSLNIGGDVCGAQYGLYLKREEVVAMKADIQVSNEYLLLLTSIFEKADLPLTPDKIDAIERSLN